MSVTPGDHLAPGNQVMPGTHEMLADAAPPPRAGERGAAPGYAPGRTLPLRIEIRRQLTRRRTQLALALLVVLPLVLVAAFKFGSPGGGNDANNPLLSTATTGALNFTAFTLYAGTGFLLVVVVALFAGDAVASEASWSTLRYLLAAPVPRSRLLRQKLLVALGFGLFSIVLLPAVSLLAGLAAFGWHPVNTPGGGTLDGGQALVRLVVIVVYLAVVMLFVAALGFFVSVHTDAPLAAVGGTVMLVIVSDILDQVSALGSVRPWLPTHYQYAWTDAVSGTITWDNMTRGALFSICYSGVLLALAWRRFLRKDIVS